MYYVCLSEFVCLSVHVRHRFGGIGMYYMRTYIFPVTACHASHDILTASPRLSKPNRRVVGPTAWRFGCYCPTNLFLQLCSFKIHRSTFLNYINIADLPISEALKLWKGQSSVAVLQIPGLLAWELRSCVLSGQASQTVYAPDAIVQHNRCWQLSSSWMSKRSDCNRLAWEKPKKEICARTHIHPFVMSSLTFPNVTALKF